MQQIQMIPIEKLREHPDNPRLIKTGKFKDLCDSIRRNQDYFETRPILCNPQFVIFAGTMRWRAAKEIGMTEVPCVVMDISDERQREIMVRDNQSSGEWDVTKLALFGEPLLINAGFSKVELHEKFALFRDAEEDDFDADAEASKIKTPITKPGEIIQLGRHRLMCGDSTNIDDVRTLMGKERADLLYTDPPYNVGYRYNAQKYEHSEEDTFDDDKTAEDYQLFCDAFLASARAVCVDNVVAYVWFPDKWARTLYAAFERNGFLFHQNVIWLKNQPMVKPGVLYLRTTETCFVATTKGKKAHVNGGNPGAKDYLMDETIENFAHLLDVWYARRDKVNDYEHPTQKPLKLAMPALKKSLKTGGTVLDLFGGSGSTLLSTDAAGGSARLMELDPIYCDVIRARWERWLEAHPESGKSQSPAL